MTNQYALGFKAGLDAAVKVCHDIERKRWETMIHGGSLTGWTPKDVAEAIAALPVPEVQWRDDEALDALQDMVRTLTDGPDDSDVARVFNKARAVIAKLKEKQLSTNSCQNSTELVEMPQKLHRSGSFGD